METTLIEVLKPEAPAPVAVKPPAEPATKKTPKTKKVVRKVKEVKVGPKQTARAVTPGRDGSRAWGPGTKQFKFKPLSVRGECDVLGCKSKARRPTAFRCAKHRAEIRRVQLKLNNQTWFKRIEKGTAKHHVVYTSPVTGKRTLSAWAMVHPDKALAQVKKGVSVVEPDEFKKLVEQAKKLSAANKKGAKARAK